MNDNSAACAYWALGDTLANQYGEEKCICASCWIAFNQLHNFMRKHYPSERKHPFYKTGLQYWETLKKRNSIILRNGAVIESQDNARVI